MKETAVIIKKGFLPCGTDQASEQGNTVYQLADGSIIFDAPHNQELNLQKVPEEKIHQIQWDE